MPSVLVVMGSQRESCRVLPLCTALKKKNFSVILCSSVSGDPATYEIFSLLEMYPHIELPHVETLTPDLLAEFTTMFDQYRFSMVVVESTSELSLAAALVAHYQRVPSVLLESPLSRKKGSEQGSSLPQRLIPLIATYHFTSTAVSAAQVVAQGVRRDAVFCVGNMRVDLLRSLECKVPAGMIRPFPAARGHRLFVYLDTQDIPEDDCHSLLSTLCELADGAPSLCIIGSFEYSDGMHKLERHGRFFKYTPGSYHDYLSLLLTSTLVLTNVYQVQEEAICLDKPVVLMQSSLHCVEALWAGLTYLTTIERQSLLQAIDTCMRNYKPGKAALLYGTGTAAEQGAAIIEEKMKSYSVMV
jgi:UDP-N-acetylglucosamine 2-epimerase (non-hydrolysing)